MNRTWDVVIVGGGAAGLSAALVLGRGRRRTLVVDAGEQSNRAAHGIGGLLGSDGRPPEYLYAAGRKELEAYPSVEVRDGVVVRGERRGDHDFVLDLADGTRVETPRVLLATGMDYRPMEVPGVWERWGHSVFHCPFCHGWEVRERPLCVLDPSPTGVHKAVLLRMWSDDVTLLTNGPAALDDGERAQLRAAGIDLDDRPVARLDGPGDELTSVVFTDGGERQAGGLMVATTMHQRSDLATQLGAANAPPNPIAADALEVDAMFQTTSPGVFAAGDSCVHMPSVANAIAAGSNAAAMIVRSILESTHSAQSSPR
jgi:thioredoxin reductase